MSAGMGIRKKTANEYRYTAAGILGVMMLVIVLLSSSYISLEAGHNCNGEQCPICACVRICENILKQAGNGITAAVVIFAFLRILLCVSAFVLFSTLVKNTLISEKVRMNN